MPVYLLGHLFLYSITLTGHAKKEGVDNLYFNNHYIHNQQEFYGSRIFHSVASMVTVITTSKELILLQIVHPAHTQGPFVLICIIIVKLKSIHTQTHKQREFSYSTKIPVSAKPIHGGRLAKKASRKFYHN